MQANTAVNKQHLKAFMFILYKDLYCKHYMYVGTYVLTKYSNSLHIRTRKLKGGRVSKNNLNSESYDIFCFSKKSAQVSQ